MALRYAHEPPNVGHDDSLVQVVGTGITVALRLSGATALAAAAAAAAAAARDGGHITAAATLL